MSGLVVLDEIQLRPDLFSLLRVLADRPDAPELLRHTAESLAGRDEAFFWGLHSGAGLDLLLNRSG